MTIDIATFLATLPVMGLGMAGIFVVMGVIILTITVLKKLCK